MNMPLQRFFIKSNIGIDSLEPNDAGYVMKAYDVLDHLIALDVDFDKACDIYKEEIERLSALIILNADTFNNNIAYARTLEKQLECADQEMKILIKAYKRANNQSTLAILTLILVVVDGALKYLGIV